MTFSVRRASLLILALTTSTLASLGLAAPVSNATPLGSAPAPAVARKADPRPNIVFITTDDQNVSDLQWMPHTRRLLAGRGFTFTEALSPHPLCCPARAEWVTGQYGQNNGVHHNEGVHGGYQALRSPSNTIARWLDTAGYQTAMVGKYMNGYRGTDPKSLVGWNHWNPMIRGTMSYRHTTFLNDGYERLHTGHVDDVVTTLRRGLHQGVRTPGRPVLRVGVQPVPAQPVRPRRRHQPDARRPASGHVPGNS